MRSNAVSAHPVLSSPVKRFWINIRTRRPNKYRRDWAAISAAAAPTWAFARRWRRPPNRRQEGSEMAEYKWPEADKRSLIGKRISRVDGPLKVSGRAKYSFD